MHLKLCPVHKSMGSAAWDQPEPRTVRVWDGYAVKFGCDDYCTPINVINFIKYKKKEEGVS